VTATRGIKTHRPLCTRRISNGIRTTSSAIVFFVTFKANSIPLVSSHHSSLQLHSLSNPFPRHYHSTDIFMYSQVYPPCTLLHSSSPPASPWPWHLPAFSAGLKLPMESGLLATHGTVGLGTVSPLRTLAFALQKFVYCYTNRLLPVRQQRPRVLHQNEQSNCSDQWRVCLLDRRQWQHGPRK
jgi:hypothetical protein